MSVHTFVVFCMVLWPKTCTTVEIVPVDDHRAASTAECAMGGMMVPTAEFTYNGDRWQLKGVQCREDQDDEVATWLRDHRP